jgi:hypothetical protein
MNLPLAHLYKCAKMKAINAMILTTFSGDTENYAVFGDPEGQREGVFWFVEGEVSDGAGQRSQGPH